MPSDQWPDGVNRAFVRLNRKLYTLMQGPSEMGSTPNARLANWDRTADLAKITVPTLVIGAKYDTMDPAHMEKMSKLVKRGRYLYCANGSHMAMYDDQKTYFGGVIGFVKDVNQGKF
jgi:proline iminopeptidase